MEQMINVHRPYHQSRRRRVLVALTAADGVCHSMSAALIISQQCRQYLPRPRPCRLRTNEWKQ